MANSIMIVKRTGEVVEFDPLRIRNAIHKAVVACESQMATETLDKLVGDINEELAVRFNEFYPNVENVQDVVEKHLVKGGHYEIAKAYILYRASRQKEREEERKKTIQKSLLGKLTVKKRDGRTVMFDINKIKETIARAAYGYESVVLPDLVSQEFIKNIFDGITSEEIEKALILATTSFVERDPAYGQVAARLFMQKICKEVTGRSVKSQTREDTYREAFRAGIKKGVEEGLFDARMLTFDLGTLAKGLKLERDELFDYMGIHTLYERYFAKAGSHRIELPQAFWMRVAMGLSLDEKDKELRAIEFYEVLSSFRFMSSTPTLFHSGTPHPQLSSCYLTTVEDDLGHIFKCLSDNAMLSKWSGGLGNDWTNIRATGSWIKSTNVESQGVIPFLKIANDVTAAINRSGKRRGATCAYMEVWHLDYEDFLDLRKNTGDDRRRTHDMNTASWIPDLFMKRVIADENWTFFSPDEVPDLHHTYGRKFEKRYLEYEEKSRNGKIKKHKVISAKKLWRKMLSMLFETGHPWITFKDVCNIRSPQDHVGVIHSSNLCTEITLNTSKDETAVCNLGSINMGKHIKEGKVDEELLSNTVKIAIRMLDNVVDINYYPTQEAKNSNMRHRPVGLGVMGVQDAFFLLDVAFESEGAIAFSDNTMEFISYHAILASSELAKEKGAYESFKGSKWDRGIMPLDTVDLLEQERGMKVEVNRDARLDWNFIRNHIKEHGMRNSNTMAIAPTATISTIVNCYPCIEPMYKNIYVKSNMSGEFTIVNKYLVDDLKKLSLWNNEMLELIKYYDGDLELIPTIPRKLKDKYRSSFEVDPFVLLKHTAVRAKWIDQSQSHNVFLKGISGKTLNDVYISAWKMGLKTTYYLRSLGASQIEKSTLDASKFGFTQKREYSAVEATPVTETEQQGAQPVLQPTIVSGGDTCEACQ